MINARDRSQRYQVIWAALRTSYGWEFVVETLTRETAEASSRRTRLPDVDEGGALFLLQSAPAGPFHEPVRSREEPSVQAPTKSLGLSPGCLVQKRP